MSNTLSLSTKNLNYANYGGNFFAVENLNYVITPITEANKIQKNLNYANYVITSITEADFSQKI